MDSRGVPHKRQRTVGAAATAGQCDPLVFCRATHRETNYPTPETLKLFSCRQESASRRAGGSDRAMLPGARQVEQSPGVIHKQGPDPLQEDLGGLCNGYSRTRERSNPQGA
ncbi:Hypothetical protein Deide_3p00272 (plasmid) [Deinococcus deserti VCD115]|uniref:Uncharacterized protein n=1 Tax=Deinococcus deserti (strain DSM 17065 / CIP 109153 / LMG 22923 / VCD115) TaxID=546414 RepID=C1D456_DEIDV|nr:Hypothetical protein Deide_3p00272 [Deinococcus deserti VCD115]